jgi:predicted ribosome quality control (RQC) complex YloA/Tae2 family protein
MINEELKQQVMEDMVLLWLIGVKVVLVHGGGPEISELMEKLGKKTQFVDGLRVTDKETVEIAQMVLSGKINKAKKRLSAIVSREKESNSLEDNKIFGELILSNIYKIKNGDKSLTALNYYNGQEVVISLDSNLTPSQNAERYFKKYNKQKRALLALKPQKENAEKELNYLNSVFAELEIAEDIVDLKLILEELTLSSIVETPKNQKKKKERELLTYDYLGFRIKVGKNNAENDKITGSAKSEDVWLHVKDYHSSHVVIETNGKRVSAEVLKFAGEVCAYYSKCRNSEKIEVVYTLKKHVKKPPKSPLGFCVYENFKSIIVNPNKHQEILSEK